MYDVIVAKQYDNRLVLLCIVWRFDYDLINDFISDNDFELVCIIERKN